MIFFHYTCSTPFTWTGVDLFFILSGYLITNALLQDRQTSFRHLLRRFYVRRAQRLLPAYAVCLGLIALLMHDDLRRLWPFYAFSLQNVPYAARWIGWSPLLPLWPLAVVQHFYLVWPFLLHIVPYRRLAPCMIALLIGVPALRAVCTPFFPFSEPIYVLAPFRIDAMAAGALAALVLPECRPALAKRWAIATLLVGMALYAALSLHPWFQRDANTAVFNGLAYSLNILILGSALVLTLLAGPRSWLVRLLASSPLRGLGRVSYGFSLFHVLIFMRFTPYLAPRVVVPGAFLMTLALAKLSWRFIERPVLSLGGAHPGASSQPHPMLGA